MDARLTTELWVQALVRRAGGLGAFATVVRRGDRDAGAVILHHVQPGGGEAALARITAPGGGGQWDRVRATPEHSREAIAGYLARQVEFDPDLWIVELVAEDITPFIDGMNPAR